MYVCLVERVYFYSTVTFSSGLLFSTVCPVSIPCIFAISTHAFGAVQNVVNMRKTTGTAVTTMKDCKASILPPPIVSNKIATARSEEHTSELQSRFDLVCRLLLEKKNKLDNNNDKERIENI